MKTSRMVDILGTKKRIEYPIGFSNAEKDEYDNQIRDYVSQQIPTAPNKQGMTHGRQRQDLQALKEERLRQQNPTFKPTYNPLVHLNKTYQDVKMGAQQALGLGDVDEQKQYWKDAEIFEATNPWTTKVLPTALLLAPSFSRSIPGQSISGAGHLTRLATGGKIGKGVVDYGRKITEQAQRMGKFSGVPGVGGGAIGSGQGATMMTNPNLPIETQLQDRLRNILTQGTLGASFDFGLTAGRYGIDKYLANKQRRTVSGDLPTPVRLPSGELWGESDQITTLRRTASQSGDMLEESQEASTRARSAIKNAHDDIAKNAEEIETAATGITQPMNRGEAMDLYYKGTYKPNQRADRAVMGSAYADAANAGPVHLDGSWFSNLKSTITTNLKAGGYDPTNTKVRSIIKRINEVAYHPRDPKTGKMEPKKVSGKDFQTLQKFISNKLGDAKGQAGRGKNKSVFGAMSSIMSDFRNFTDEALDNNWFTGATEAITRYKQATGIAKNYYGKYYSTPILAKMSDNKLSSTEASERVFGPGFGVTTIKDSPMRLQTLNSLKDIGGDKKNGLLKKEMYGYLFNRNRRDPKFGSKDQKDFITTIDKTDKANRTNATFDTLSTPSEKRQIRNMKEVTDRRHADPKDPENYEDPTVWQQFYAKPRLAGTESLLKSLPGSSKFAKFKDWRTAMRQGSGRQFKLSNRPLAAYGPALAYRQNMENEEEKTVPWDFGPSMSKWLYHAINSPEMVIEE